MLGYDDIMMFYFYYFGDFRGKPCGTQQHGMMFPTYTLFLVLFSVFALLMAEETNTEESNPPTKRTRIKACTGFDLPFDADVKIGNVGEKKECEHFQKSKFGDYLLVRLKSKLYKDCTEIHSTDRDPLDPSTSENSLLTFQFGMGKLWMKALNMGMKKMCRGEKRRITGE